MIGKLRTLSIYSVAFIIVLDTAAIIPILALYARYLGAAPLLIGFIVSIYAPLDITFNFLSGILADRIGRRRILIVGYLVDALAMFLYSQCSIPLQLLLVRAFHGCGSGLNMPALMTIIADVMPRKHRGKGMSGLGLCFALAFTIGMSSSGMISYEYGFKAVFYMFSLIMLIGVVLSLIILPETYSKRKEEPIMFLKTVKEAFILLTVLPIAITFMVVFCREIVKPVMTTLFPLYLADIWGVEGKRAVRKIAGFLFSVPVATYAITVIPSGFISDRVGRRIPIVIGLLMLGGFLLLIPCFSTVAELIPLMIMRGVADALIYPSLTALVADNTSIERRSRGYGLYSGVDTLSSLIGGPTSGYIAELVGYGGAIRYFSAIPIVGAAILIVTLVKRLKM